MRGFDVNVWFCSTIYGLCGVSSLRCDTSRYILMSTGANLKLMCRKKERAGGKGNKEKPPPRRHRSEIYDIMMVQEVVPTHHCASHFRAAIGCGRAKNGRIPGNGRETG